MKNYWNRLVMPLMVAMVLMAGCKDKEVDPAAPMNAKVDGQAWNSKGITGVRAQKQITLSGTNQAGEVIALSFPDKTGTYNITSAGTSTVVSYNPTLSTRPYVTNLCISNPDGQIIVTQLDTINRTVTGTFRGKVCNGSEIKNVTEGVFNNIKYK